MSQIILSIFPRPKSDVNNLGTNYRNLSHIDLDDSPTIILQLEENTGFAKDWNIILPNTIENGNYKNVIIKNFNGLLISIDAMNIYHCTSLGDVGFNNNTYGYGFYSKICK